MQLFVNETKELTHITTSDGEVITSTPTHPYYTQNRGWLSAKNLRAGDILLTVNGKYVIVELVAHELLEKAVKVYNFEVADYHTYYVASNINAARDAFVLVHNKCTDKLTTNAQSNAAAKNIGYSKVNGVSSHGQAVYTNSKAATSMKYITADIDSHSGGVWKAASSIKNLGSKSTCTGTFSLDLLTRIGS